MSDKINDILTLMKSIPPEAAETPMDIIEIGNGYVLVHTHTNAASVSERSEGYTGIDFFEVRHPASEQVLASLTGMSGGEDVIIKVGLILPDFKAPGMSKNIHEAMVKRYGKCSDDLLSFLQTSWGDAVETPSVSPSDKTGDWTRIHELLNSFASLKKSMMVKVNGHRGWHKVNDIQDTKLPADHKHGGNVYHITHSKTNENMAVHQSDLADLAHESELKDVSYKKRSKTLEKFAAGAPGLTNAGATGMGAISKTPVKSVIDLSKTTDERDQKLMGLGSETQIGSDAFTGKRAFLLYRGMEKDEYKQTVEPDNRVMANQQSTWTPYPDVAMEFSPTGFLVGAWISEENLILQDLAPSEQLDLETNKMSLYKVIVRPHQSTVLSSAQTKMIIEQMKG